jgi:ketosteroid isomerase-like protein
LKAIAILFVVACSSGHSFQPEDRTAITAVLETQQAAWNRGDLTAYMDGYAKIDNLIFTSGAKVRKGWQAAFDAYQKRYGKDPSSMGKLDFAITQIDPVGADGAVVLGTWKLDGPNAGAGVFSLVWERRPEGWRIVHDHTSAETK